MTTRWILATACLFLVSCGKPSATPTPATNVSLPEESLKGVARTRFDSPDPTPAQRERRKRNSDTIRQMKLPVLDSLPVVEEDAAVRPRSTEEIAQRCLATAICAVKGETNDQELTVDLLKRFPISPHLSPEEQSFAQEAVTTDKDRAKFAWRYECVHVFLWSLGFLEELQPPNELCDVSGEMGIIRDKGFEGLKKEAKPRSVAEILDQADYYYRLHWSAIELRLKGTESEAINEEIILERHRALNWLIRYLDQAWDDVTTDT